MVRGEGMPQYRNPFEKGDLYIKFDVQFPDNNWISSEKLTVRPHGWEGPTINLLLCLSRRVLVVCDYWYRL